MILAVLSLIAAAATTPCDGPRFASGNAILLQGSDYSIIVPDGWWLQSGAYPQRPELGFELPHACEGGVRSHPSLQVARLDGDERPASLDDVGRDVRDAVDGLRAPPVRTTIAGHDAVEYATTGELIAHALDGRSSQRPLYYRIVVVELGDELFECRLTEDVFGTEAYDAMPRTLCASLALRPDARPYER